MCFISIFSVLSVPWVRIFEQHWAAYTDVWEKKWRLSWFIEEELVIMQNSLKKSYGALALLRPVLLLSCQCLHLSIQEVRLKRLRGTQWGYLSAVYLLLLGEWRPWNCYSSSAWSLQTGVWNAEEGCLGLCVSVLKQKPRGGGVVWWIERQVCCSARPSTGVSHHALHALSQNSLWLWVWRQISHTLANSNKFPLSLRYHHFPASTVEHETAWLNVSDFYGMWGTQSRSRALIWQYK